ncbi:MAG: leucyl/phenylalanyl-tRNA--protein transferase [Chitinophagaceae bacterium]
MAVTFLDNRIQFPPVENADEDGLLAIGGDLSPDRIKLAYSKGIFPWFSGEIPEWWSPDPRFVLYPDELIVSKSMKQLLKRNAFDFTINNAFEDVINACSKIQRRGQSGTWITKAMQKSYLSLHKDGVAISAETWKDNQLVGGLYGILSGKVFCGESMFSKESNSSKYAFIRFVEYLKSIGVILIDCQVHTEHLESLGARMITRKEFLKYLE